MADRRMFSKTIIGAGRFLKMPQSSRLLYYDLGMYADDDGVVEAFTVMRQTGANEDDLRVLASKGYVRILNEELVTYILDWKANNTIKSDRYHPSAYANLLVQLSDGSSLVPSCIQVGSSLEPEIRLGKDSIGESREEESREGEDRIGEGRGEDLTAAAVKPDALAIYASNNLTYLSPGNMYELLSFRDSLSDDMIMYAIDAACGAGKRTYDYVRSILNRIVERGFRTLGEVKAAEEERRAKQQAAQAMPQAQAAQRTRRPMDERTYTEDDAWDPMELMNRPRSGGAR